ncbi:MAG: RiPP maturation radical SAM C-methyltransferase [Alphaproteobacteria bacterium]
MALVTMPFVSIWRPSLQIGLLSAIARSKGFSAETFHLNLEFAAAIGGALYQTLCPQRTWLLGDWLFSAAAFRAAAPDPEHRILETAHEGFDTDQLRRLRDDAVPAYLDHMVSITDWDRFDVVGFTSTFQQNVASFALARRLKETYPNLCTLFGGANFDDAMGRELVRRVPAIDYAIDGEADRAFPEFLEALAAGGDPAAVPGVLCRRNGALRVSEPRPPFDRLDDLPVPDYDEYFERVERLGLIPEASRHDIDLPFESARGCWWGQKHHCTFCGLNGTTMTYRAKSPDRLFDELATLSSRYHSFQFMAVDNILDPAYLKDLFPRLGEQQLDYKIFYETKANLRKEQIRLLGEGGVNRLQPGIESFSTRVLGLMRKGTTAIQNVNMLRWTRYYGIGAAWNLIWGFPGESEADCAVQRALLPHLGFLEPPEGWGRVWLERFSPLFRERATFPMRSMGPARNYAFVYPAEVDLEDVAYFFDYELEHALPDSAFEEIGRLIEAWKASWRGAVRPSLTYRRAPALVQIEDARDPAKPLTYSLDGPLAALYPAFSERPMSAAGAREKWGWEWPVEEIEGTLDEFCGKGLMMRDGNLFLTLALPATQGR